MYRPMKRYLKAAKVCICATQSIADELADFWKLDPGALHVIQNGFDPEDPSLHASSSPGRSETMTTFGYFGALYESPAWLPFFRLLERAFGNDALSWCW